MAILNKQTLAIFLCIMFLTMPITTLHGAITCGGLQAAMMPCMGYLMGQPGPSPSCCGGIKSLLGLIVSPNDKRTACQCVKSAAGLVTGVNYGNAASLPTKCGVNIPFQINPNVDCATLQ